MRTSIVSGIFFDLYGSDLGGRPSRNEHYLYSMNSIMKMDDVEFIIYTNHKEKVDNFFNVKYPDKLSKFVSIEYDLHNTKYRDLINRLKNVEETKRSARCIELQYAKLLWLNSNLNNSEYIYWIDAGLCYSGLIPYKYLNFDNNNYYLKYYDSEIFKSSFIENINKKIIDKIFMIGKENINFFWDNGLPEQYYINNKDISFHIIGGLFGGKSSNVKILYDLFDSLCVKVLQTENILYSEENLLTTIYYNNKSMFHLETFDLWWHEDNILGNVSDKKRALDLLTNHKSFYKILEKYR